MIREKTLFCKLFLSKVDSESLIKACYGNLDMKNEVCPHCGCRGKCVRYGYYDRCLVDCVDGQIATITVSVPRLLCTNCSTEEHKVTHGVLPDCIVPYGGYSLFFILWVLYERICCHRKISEICEKYWITPPVLYRWLKLLRKHMQDWLGVLEAASSSSGTFLDKLLHLDSFSVEFEEPFLRRTTFSFLQHHANPANCRYPKFPA